MEEQISMSIHDYEASSSSSPSNSESSQFSPNNFQLFTKNGMFRLQETVDNENSEYMTIKKCLMQGNAFSRMHNVVAIHKNLYNNHVGEAKLEAFRIFSKAVAEKRGGDANIKYAWYGGSKEEISEIIGYGFGYRSTTKVEENGMFCSRGIVFSPANVPNESVLRAVEDENGLRHMLICRVILGNSELVRAGSDQFQPSSTEFDSGIDNPLAPRNYIIWRAHMNTRVFPNYVVTFKNLSLSGLEENGPFNLKPNLRSTKMPMLFNGLSRFMDSTKMGLVLDCYNDFQVNKVNRSLLIERLRKLVGDNLLMQVMKPLQTKDELN